MEGISVCCLSFNYLVNCSYDPTSHLAGVLLKTQESAVLSVKLFGLGLVVLEKAACRNTRGQAIDPFRTGTFQSGTALVSLKLFELSAI